jgi:hypothetical protein
MIGEVRVGLRQINTEVVHAARSKDCEASGSRHFSEMMAAFHAGAAEDFKALEVGGVRVTWPSDVAEEGMHA